MNNNVLFCDNGHTAIMHKENFCPLCSAIAQRDRLMAQLATATFEVAAAEALEQDSKKGDES